MPERTPLPAAAVWIAASVSFLAACAETQLGQGGSMVTGSAALGSEAQGETVQLPKCQAPLGTLALVEDQSPGLAQYGLGSPMPLLRLMVAQSNCFNVVDRGQALTRIQQEQALTGGGGKPKLVQAQYFLTPNIIVKGEKTGGGDLGLGGILPGWAGALAGAVGVDNSEAQVALFLTQTDTGLQVAASEGSAKTADWKVRSFGWVGLAGGFGNAYSDTPIGKTVSAALLDAYRKLVAQLAASGA